MSPEKKYFPALTGIRAIAALMVYATHVNPIPKTFPRLWGFFDELYVGVSFFFVLSGLLIGLRYSGQTINWKKYLVYRAARIYPMWIFFTLLTFIFLYKYNAAWWKLLLVNLALLKGFSQNIVMSGIDQGWSLTVEECFYLLAPFLIVLLPKLLASGKKYLVFILPGVFLAVGFALSYICNLLHIPAFQSFDFVFVFTIFGRSWEFILGLLLALLYKKHPEKITLWYNNFPGVNWLFFLCIIGVIYTMSVVRIPGELIDNSIEGKLLTNFVLPVFTGAFYLGLMVRKDFFAGVLSSRAAVIGGKASYIFYLIHIGVVRYFLAYAIDDYIPDNFWRWLVKNAAMILISAGLYYAMEEPLNKFIKNLFLKKDEITKSEIN